MSKVRVGVIGVGRGSMIGKYCQDADNAEVVAICDKWEEGLKKEIADYQDVESEDLLAMVQEDKYILFFNQHFFSMSYTLYIKSPQPL